MALIPLSKGFTMLAEGHYTFKITEVNYDEDFGDMKVTFENEEGGKHRETYNLLTKDGSPNEGALAAFSYMAKAAINDSEAESIDSDDLIGCVLEADIVHTESTSKKTGKPVTYAHITNFTAADAPAPRPAPQKPKKKSLADLLG